MVLFGMSQFVVFFYIKVSNWVNGWVVEVVKMFKVAGLLPYESPRMKGIIDSTCLKTLELELEIINRSRQKDDCLVGLLL